MSSKFDIRCAYYRETKREKLAILSDLLTSSDLYMKDSFILLYVKVKDSQSTKL